MLTRPGGGASEAPPIEISVPNNIQTCCACHNPIFSWGVRWKYFFPIQSHQSGLERRERHPGGVHRVKLDVIFYYV